MLGLGGEDPSGGNICHHLGSRGVSPPPDRLTPSGGGGLCAAVEVSKT